MFLFLGANKQTREAWRIIRGSLVYRSQQVEEFINEHPFFVSGVTNH